MFHSDRTKINCTLGVSLTIPGHLLAYTPVHSEMNRKVGIAHTMAVSMDLLKRSRPRTEFERIVYEEPWAKTDEQEEDLDFPSP